MSTARSFPVGRPTPPVAVDRTVPPSAPRVELGCRVYGRHGRYIGTVDGISPSLFRVRGTMPMRSVYYVPAWACIGMLPGGHEVFVDCAIDDIDRRGWLHPPERPGGPD
jgi:hypothetical protein